MKHFLNFLTLAFAIAISTKSNATILVANNSTTSPGQYSTLQAAIDAASSGDTIHVQPSANIYDNQGYIDLNKKLTLIGIGHEPVKDNPLIASLAPLLRISGEASSLGFTIIGLAVGTCKMACGQPVHNATFINCKVGFGLTYESNCFSPQGWYDLHVENCLVYETNLSASGDNLFFTSCIFNGNPNHHFGAVTTNLLVRNSLFIHWENNGGNAGIRSNGGTFENNIFYYNGPATGNGDLMTNCTMNNNLTYLTANDNVLSGSNTGMNNIIGQDPLFVSYVSSTTPYQTTFNYRLQESSPGHNAGTDGTDIGPYGGGITFSETGEYPELPVVRVMNIDNATVPSEGTISIHVKVTKSKTDH